MTYKIGVAIPIKYYAGASGLTIKARIMDEAAAVFGVELTLVENAAFVAAVPSVPGVYESTFTPDAAGTWAAFFYYAGVKVGQVFYDVGGGLTTQGKTDVQDEAEDALEGEDLDHLVKVAHPTGDPTADSLIDLIMNKDGGQTFARATDSLEIIGEIVASILTDTATIVWGDITTIDGLIDAIIADIGVFPTVNYPTLADYVQDIRGRLNAIVGDTNELQVSLADGGFTDLLIDSIIERTSNLPDDPADASVIAAAHALLATEAKQDIIDGIVDDIKALLVNGGVIDQLLDDILEDTGTTLENRQDAIRSDQIEANERAFLRRYPFVTTNESVANAAEVDLAAPGAVTPTFPTGSTRLNSYVVAILKVNNQTAAEHNIGVTLQKNIAAAGWQDVRDFTASPPLTLPAVDATADSITLIEPVSITSGQSVQFRFQVDSDNAGEVHYTQVFFFAVEYDFQ